MKSKHHHQHQNQQPAAAANTNTNAPAAAKNSGRLSTEEISAKAYEIYQQQGCPEGHALDHWLQAEASAGVRPNANA